MSGPAPKRASAPLRTLVTLLVTIATMCAGGCGNAGRAAGPAVRTPGHAHGPEVPRAPTKPGAGSPQRPRRTTTTTAPPSGTLVIAAHAEETLTDDFNPFAASSPLSQMGVPMYIYEPLLEYSDLQADEYYPWLASSWSFSSSGLTITFNLRPNVTWADGSPLNAADVAYTFNLLKADPRLSRGIPIVSAQAQGPGTFVLSLSRPGYSYLYNIARVPIVKAGYGAGKDLAGYVDSRPDGTGPYELSTPLDFSAHKVTLTARARYWQGAPPFQRLVFPALPTRGAVVTALDDGAVDWAAEPLGSGAQAYVDKDSAHNHFWAPAVGSIALELNLLDKSFGDRSVREAVSDAIDRAELSRQLQGRVGGAVPSLSGLVLPRDNAYLTAADTGDVPARPSPAAIGSLMRSAGYHMSAQGYWAKGAQGRIQVNIEDPAGSNLSTAAEVVAQQLDAAGFDASSSAPPPAKWHSDLVGGDFVASVLPSADGPSPYYMFEQWLDPSLVVGGNALGGDYERLSPATDSAVAAAAAKDLSSFGGSLSGSAGATTALKALGQLVADQLPVIPLIYSVAWGEYSTAHATGWPGSQDPYEPASPRSPSAEYTVLQLSSAAAP